MKPTFTAGKNIAMKVPSHEFKKTVEFYGDVLGLPEADVADKGTSQVFEFGGKNLWVDKIDGISQAEIWLEIETDDIDAASGYLAEKGCIRRDEIEPLPNGYKGFWVSSPSNIIHLMTEKQKL